MCFEVDRLIKIEAGFHWSTTPHMLPHAYYHHTVIGMEKKTCLIVHYTYFLFEFCSDSDFSFVPLFFFL